MQQLDEQLALVTGPAIKCVLTLAQLDLLARKIKGHVPFSEVEEHELKMLASLFIDTVMQHEEGDVEDLDTVHGFAL